METSRVIGMFNWYGLRTLYFKECRRFLKVALQTIFAPTVTAMLFLAIFSLALGKAVTEINGVAFLTFMAPGLIMMTIMQNSFANTSSSLMLAKVQGSISDILMPPFKPLELLVGISGAGITRGLVCGLVLSLVLLPFVRLDVCQIFALIYFAFMGALFLSLVGIITAIWAEKFDQLAAVTNFLITPLAFLSGTFYSIHRLPEPFFTASQLNPFFYLIDGFRYGLIGTADGSLIAGIIVVFIINLVLGVVVHHVLRKGWRLKT
tara:strand:+ start:17330 stop:18118 length:789 start_codon:yes stop_codon:yes gene_type:complete